MSGGASRKETECLCVEDLLYDSQNNSGPMFPRKSHNNLVRQQ